MNHLRTLALGKKATSRRQLLQALGVGVAASPFIPRLEGWAQTTGAPKRLLLLFTPDGIVPDQYWPTGTETNFTFPAGGILEPLDKHKADMIVFKDMPRYNGGSGGAHEHAMGGLWTGNSIQSNQGMAPSVDQIIAKELPKQTDFQSLQFGVQSYFNTGDANAKTASVNSYMIYSGPRARVPAEADPYKMFDRVFAGFKSPTSTAGPPSPDMTRVRLERKSVLDFVKADLDRAHKKVGKLDAAKIDAHIETIRDIERRLEGSVGGGIMAPACSPEKPPMLDLNRNENFPMLIPLTNKMVAATFACDRTRIASLQYSRAFSNHVHNWVGARETHHTLSHKTSEAPVLSRIQTFYMGHISQLFDELKAIPEGDKTMFDNMLIVYANELYLGWTHGVSPSPVFWAGSLGGTIKTGRFIDYAKQQDHNQMLTTMAHAMGVTSVNKVGDLGKPGILPNVL